MWITGIWYYWLSILLIMEDSLLCGMPMSEGESNLGDLKLVDKSSDCENKQHFDSSAVLSSCTSQVKMKVALEGYDAEDDEEEEDGNDGLSEEVLIMQMGYDKSLYKIYMIEDNQGRNGGNVEEKEMEDEILEELVQRSVDDIPTLNLVSALKGSREKEGKPAQECRVSWDPDVYDPIPAPPEEFAINNFEFDGSEPRSSVGKNRQKKGKGGGRKGADKSKEDGKADKKKGKKRGGSSSRRRSFDDC